MSETDPFELPPFLQRSKAGDADVKPGPREIALREMRAAETATKPFDPYAKAREEERRKKEKIRKLNAKLADASVTTPLIGKAALAKIAETPTASAAAKPEESVMDTNVETTETTKPARKAPATKKGAAKKAAPAKKAPAKAAAKPKGAAAKKGAAKVAPQAGERADGLRTGSKQAAMLDLALRDEGATEAAICKKLGWKKCRVTLRRVAEKVGAKLEAKKNAAGETVYFATRKG